MNYIFLDIDGVMNNQLDWTWKVNNGQKDKAMFCDEAWLRLSQVVRETGAKVILSSSWRLAFRNTAEGIEIIGQKDGYAMRLMHYFEEYNIPVIGRTTEYYDYRGKQITQYVKEHFSSDDKWVVLDDEICDMYGIPEAQMIKTEFETGLLPEHCKRIVEYFRGE